MRFASFNLADEETPERLSGARTNADFFRVFGTKPFLGRTFLPDEDVPGRNQVAVLSYGLWAGRFAGDRGVLGRSVRLSGLDYTVIGVMPPDFDPTLSGEQLWVPIAFTPEQRAQHDEHYLIVVALLKPAVATAEAQGDMDGVMRDLAARFLPWLATFGSVSPLLGLLGTVLGVMDAFIGIAVGGSGNIAAVAPGVAEALVTTVAGLAVAVPAVMAYNLYVNRLGLFAGELEGFAQEIIGTLAREGRI